MTEWRRRREGGGKDQARFFIWIGFEEKYNLLPRGSTDPSLGTEIGAFLVHKCMGDWPIEGLQCQWWCHCTVLFGTEQLMWSVLKGPDQLRCLFSKQSSQS